MPEISEFAKDYWLGGYMRINSFKDLQNPPKTYVVNTNEH